jgi:hypothetical protein
MVGSTATPRKKMGILKNEYNLNNKERAELTVKLGGYNEMPPNWQEITESEFIWRWGQQQRISVFRQVILPTFDSHGSQKITGKRKMYCDVNMFVNSDFGGIGWIEHYNGAATRSEIDAYKAQWFKWAWCEHSYKTTLSRMCYREYECEKCGYKMAVDSSD